MRYRFGPFELDLSAHDLRRDGTTVPLEPQVFDLLALLIAHAGELVDRDTMVAEVWGGRIVSEATISSRIAALRRALGDDGKRQEAVQTVQRRGLRFVLPVRTLPLETPTGEPGDAEVGSAPGTPTAPSPVFAQSIRMARSADGTGIAWATTGDGPPLLKAGHFLTHLEHDWQSPIWQPQLARLSRSFTLTRYDQRSTGLSDPVPPSLTLDALTDDLEAVADAAGLERFPIFAASQGVPVSIAFATRHPERVSALVLYGGYAQGRTLRVAPEEQRQAEAILTIIRAGWGRGGSTFATAFTTLYMPDASAEQLAHATEMQLASATPEAAAALRAAIDRFDVTDRLAEVRAPTLILHTEGDAVHPVAQARVLASGIPGAELHVLAGRNHAPVPGRPECDALYDGLEGFLAAHPG